MDDMSATPSVPVRKAKFSNILAQGEFPLALIFHVKNRPIAACSANLALLPLPRALFPPRALLPPSARYFPLKFCYRAQISFLNQRFDSARKDFVPNSNESSAQISLYSHGLTETNNPV